MEIGSTRITSAGPGRLSAATSFWARTVVDQDGQLIGSICDLMLDSEHGRIAYAVVATGGFMGNGEMLFAVPWSALRAVGRQLVLECKCDALQSGPSFDRDHWPEAPAYRWHEWVHGYYHARPYWE